MTDYSWNVVKITKRLHDAYERHALSHGWETQVASRKVWDDVPQANKDTMLSMVAEVWPELLEDLAVEIETYATSDVVDPWYDGFREGLEQAAFMVRSHK